MKAAFVEAFNSILSDKSALLADIRGMVYILTDTSELDKKHLVLVAERAELHDRMTRLVRESAQTAMDQQEFGRQNYVMEARMGGPEKRLRRSCARLLSAGRGAVRWRCALGNCPSAASC